MEDNTENTEETQSTSATAEGSWWGTWSQGWLDTVKEKSAITMQMVKNDLNEFVEIIQGDTSEVISETASKLEDGEEGETKNDGGEMQGSSSESSNFETATKVMKKGVSKFLHSVSELMAVPPDDSNDEIITVGDFNSLKDYNRKQEKLHIIQTNPGTFCNEPEGYFTDWLEIFNLYDHKQEMSNMLVQNPAVRAIYTQLVPAVVSHTTFWQRYFYQVFLLDAEEKKREEIVARANSELNKDEGQGGWDDDDDDEIEVLSSKTIGGISDHSLTNTVTTIDIDKENKPKTIEKNDILTEITITEPLKCNVEKVSISEAIEKSGTNINETAESNLNLDIKNQINEPPEDSEKTDGQILNNSVDTVEVASSIDTESDNETIQGNIDTEQIETRNPGVSSPHAQLLSLENSETSSLSSWMSIDDVIKVKKIKGDQEVKSDTNGTSANVSTDSNGVMVMKSDAADESDEDFDLDLEDLDPEVNEEEVAKMVEDIKNKSAAGTLGDEDDDWENWE